jgi:hypothetical protein
MDHQTVSQHVNLEICALKTHQQPEALDFLRAAFTGAPPALLSAPFLEWKCFSPRPDWNGSRSYAIRQGERMVAHACVWPTRFCLPAGTATCGHLLDWAADRSVAGAGITLYRHLMEQTDFVLAIGGSAHARRVLPKIGFRPYGKLEYYARVNRPWRQYRIRPRLSAPRELAKLGRNIVWSLPPLRRIVNNWSAAPAFRAGPWLDDIAARTQPETITLGSRSADLVNYVLSCPAADCYLSILERDGTACGYFILNQIGGQCRIVDLFVASQNPADWSSACRLAFHTAAAAPNTCETVYAVALPWMGEILRENGFHKRDERPILAYDPQNLLSAAPPLHIQMVNSDAFCIYNLSYPFLT